MTVEAALPQFPPVPAWWSQAACQGMGCDVFHPALVRGRVSTGLAAAIANAKAICQRCPVRIECLDDAMATPSRYDRASGSIRGGLTPGERRRPDRTGETGRVLRAQRKAGAA